MICIEKDFGDARAFWNAPDSKGVTVAWLGQAGFAIRSGEIRLVIDPYLSDSLEKKYRASDKPHRRLTPAPVTPEELSGINYVLCTHQHSDHMDPETLSALAGAQRECIFIVPAAHEQRALSLGLPAGRLVVVDAGETFFLTAECSIRAIPAAHESLDTNDRGQHPYLGYILRTSDATVYHSGDTVPFPGLVEALLNKRIDVALLPVNGRGKGVPGNLTFEEAAALCREAGIPHLVPHHFGMFAFNTVDPVLLAKEASACARPMCHMPDMGSWLRITRIP